MESAYRDSLIIMGVYTFLLFSPFLVGAMWWLAKGMNRSPWKRSILIALTTWLVLGVWWVCQWGYQLDRNRTVSVCIVKKKDAPQAEQILRQHGITVEWDCFRNANGPPTDYCQAFVRNFQVDRARDLVPGEQYVVRSE